MYTYLIHNAQVYVLGVPSTEYVLICSFVHSLISSIISKLSHLSIAYIACAVCNQYLPPEFHSSLSAQLPHLQTPLTFLQRLSIHARRVGGSKGDSHGAGAVGGVRAAQRFGRQNLTQTQDLVVLCQSLSSISMNVQLEVPQTRLEHETTLKLLQRQSHTKIIPKRFGT